MNAIKSEDAPHYEVKVQNTDDEDLIVKQAMLILQGRLHDKPDVLISPKMVSQYLITRLSALEHEVFGCIYLNIRNQVIIMGELFRGTLGAASVYPREVVKEVLKHNAASVILYHNHPSGSFYPSAADISITNRLRDALELIDVRILDHLIVGGVTTSSFAERGLL